MSYATVKQVIDRFDSTELLRLTDERKTGTIDESVVQDALDDAQGEMDSYISQQYALPITVDVKILTIIQCDIARYNLHENGATDEVFDRYQSRIKFLGQLAAGKVKLINDSGVEIGSYSKAEVIPQSKSKTEVFTDALLEGY